MEQILALENDIAIAEAENNALELNLQNMMKRCKLPTNVIFKIFLS
jgi:hypothetical protein